MNRIRASPLSGLPKNHIARSLWESKKPCTADHSLREKCKDLQWDVISSYNSKSTEKSTSTGRPPFTNQFTWGFVRVLMVKSDFKAKLDLSEALPAAIADTAPKIEVYKI